MISRLKKLIKSPHPACPAITKEWYLVPLEAVKSIYKLHGLATVDYSNYRILEQIVAKGITLDAPKVEYGSISLPKTMVDNLVTEFREIRVAYEDMKELGKILDALEAKEKLINTPAFGQTC
ncbi:hypothetical protein [Pedobacter sp.]|uniref:hypothetical protein n=1 Tax=Pedobacter sp. TaxID=1411316 RepID=UPI003D7F500A